MARLEQLSGDRDDLVVRYAARYGARGCNEFAVFEFAEVGPTCSGAPGFRMPRALDAVAVIPSLDALGYFIRHRPLLPT